MSTKATPLAVAERNVDHHEKQAGSFCTKDDPLYLELHPNLRSFALRGSSSNTLVRACDTLRDALVDEPHELDPLLAPDVARFLSAYLERH